MIAPAGAHALQAENLSATATGGVWRYARRRDSAGRYFAGIGGDISVPHFLQVRSGALEGLQ